jgi:spore coat protein U-like protein
MRAARRAAGVALLVAASAQQAGAAGGHALSVSASVLSKNVCRFQTAGPTALPFGAIDPASTSPVTVNLTLQYRCNGSDAVAAWTVASDDGLYESGAGQPRMRHGTVLTSFLPYTLTFPASGTVARNTITNMSISATVTPAGFANATVGAYADTLVLTLTP